MAYNIALSKGQAWTANPKAQANATYMPTYQAWT